MRYPVAVPFAFAAFILGMFAGGALLVSGVSVYERSPAHPEWSLPARFEAQGAVTMGCALWDVPQLTRFGDDNPDTSSVGITLQGDQANGYRILALIDRRSNGDPGDGGGTFLIAGQSCGLSIDWSAFDHLREVGERASPK